MFLGHLFPIFLRFKGGKGVATALGILFAFHLGIGLLAVATWIAVAAIWRFSSLAALVAAVLDRFDRLFFLGFEVRTVAVLLMSLLLVWRHKSNIASLAAGRESRIGKGNAS